MFIYVDGSLIAQRGYDPSGPRTSTGPLTIGTGAPANYGFNGLIDELELYQRVLSASEVTSLAAGALGVDFPADDQPVSHWPADGDANDAAGANHGTLKAASGFGSGRAGFGQAFRFGNADYLTVADSPALRLGTSQTVAAWYQWSGGGRSDWRRLVGKGAATTRNYGLWIHPQANAILFQMYNGAQVCNAQAWPLSDTDWRHLAGTYDGARIRLYFDGRLVSNNPCTMTPPTSGDPLTIGYANAGVNAFHSPFDRLIDDVQIHNVPLRTCDILALAGDSCRLVSHWAGEDNADDSVGPNNGTEQSGATYAPGKVGQAFSLERVEARISVTSSPSLSGYQDHTYSFWIKWLSATHRCWQQVLAKHTPGSERSPGVWNCPTTPGSATP